MALPYPILPYYQLGAGIATDFGTITAPGSRVAAYVCSASVDRSMVPGFTTGVPVYTTLNAGLAQCRAGENDIVFVLPGHTESLSTAAYMSSLVAGTQIIGLGVGSNRPTFTWTATGSTWTVNKANVTITNCILVFASTAATTVTAPMTISGVGCSLVNCRILTSASSTILSATGITVSAADCGIFGCSFSSGTSDGTGVTTSLLLTSADRFRMYDTTIRGATSSTAVGVLRFAATAAVDVDIRRCTFFNAKAASATAITGVASASGAFSDCNIGYLDNTTTTWINVGGNLQAYRCYVTNDVAENGLLGTLVSA